MDVDSGAVYDIYLPTHVRAETTDTIITVAFARILTLELSVLFGVLDPDQYSVARHHHPAKHRRHRAAGVLRGRGRVRQHLRPHHQGRSATVGGDAYLCGYVSLSHTREHTHILVLLACKDQLFKLINTLPGLKPDLRRKLGSHFLCGPYKCSPEAQFVHSYYPCEEMWT